MTKLLAIDAGTTGVKALVVGGTGAVLSRGYTEFRQYFPRPGWVEHDAEEIMAATLSSCRLALEAAQTKASEIVAIGVTNQRETTLIWDRSTLKPLHRAVVWQDRRTAGHCKELREAGHSELVRNLTGLVIDPYFSGTKISWLLDNVEGARAAAESGQLASGTMDSWIVAWLTSGQCHVTEPSNASRTMLFDIRAGMWSEQLCDLLAILPSTLPEVLPTTAEFGTSDPDRFFGVRVPITGIAGDQQAALFGQGCWVPGACKNTYGSFVLMNTGAVGASSEALVTTVAWDLGQGMTYAMEGSIFSTGSAVQWLRDGLGVISQASEIGPLAETVPDTGDVYLVPAFNGLAAPYWDPYARGTIVGLTRGTTRGHLARAVVEAMAYQARDVIEAMEGDSGLTVPELRVDGGAVVMNLLCQFQADLLGIPVLRPVVQETTALGAAYLAGLGAGVWSSTDELADLWQLERRFDPDADRGDMDLHQARWRLAVERSRGWAVGQGSE